MNIQMNFESKRLKSALFFGEMSKHFAFHSMLTHIVMEYADACLKCRNEPISGFQDSISGLMKQSILTTLAHSCRLLIVHYLK